MTSFQITQWVAPILFIALVAVLSVLTDIDGTGPR